MGQQMCWAIDRARRDSHCSERVRDVETDPIVVSLPAPRSPLQLRLAGDEPAESQVRVMPPGASTGLHAHDAPCAWRVVSGHALESVIGQPDRTWSPGEVGEIAPGAVHQISNPGDEPLLLMQVAAACCPDPLVEAPDGEERIAIVGGGMSAAALTYHLARGARRPLHVSIIERGAALGRGIAYGVASSIFRLNVPASRMSIDPAVPDDFVTWADVAATPDIFLPRTRYGAYVEERLTVALAASPVRAALIRDEAVAIDGTGVQLAGGRRVVADRVVLATGLVPRQAPAWLACDRRIVDAWNEPALHFLPPDGRLLILGSGLSAIDVLGVLEASRFRGRVVVVSRRGLLPRPHLADLAPPPPIDPALLAAAPSDLRGLVQWARAVVRSAVGRGYPWQLGFDSLRPHVPRLWSSLPPADRVRFVRAVRPFWEVLRHRAPLDALEVVERWRAEARLQLEPGRVTGCIPHPAGLEVTLRHAGVSRRERFDAIVRCIGPALDDSEAESPLIAALITGGAARRDPARLGIVTDGDGRVIEGDGAPSERLFAMGALRRASAWETTAVPEISRQAQALAALLIP